MTHALTVTLLLVAHALMSISGTALPPCDPGWTYYGDLLGTEEAARLVPPPNTILKTAASCVQAFSFPTVAQWSGFRPDAPLISSAESFCTAQHDGGHLWSLSSASGASGSLLAFTRALIGTGSGAGVLIGGLAAASSPTLGQWQWQDKYTNPAILNAPAGSQGSNWAAGEPR